MVTVRNYIHGESLPWSREEIGWDPGDGDPETCWVVFVDGRMVAMLLAAKVLNTLFLMRLMGGRGARWWVRPLWTEVRRVCVTQGIAGFWTHMDNDLKAERKLLMLLRAGRGTVSAIEVKQTSQASIAGRL